MTQELAERWLDFWQFTGTACAILAFIAAGAAVHFVKIVLPSKRAELEDRRTESRERVVAMKRMADVTERLEEPVTQLSVVVQNIHATQREHSDDLSWIKRHIRGDSDPNQSVLHG